MVDKLDTYDDKKLSEINPLDLEILASISDIEGKDVIMIHDIKEEYHKKEDRYLEFALVSYKGVLKWLLLHDERYFDINDSPYENEITSTPYIVMDNNTVYALNDFNSIDFDPFDEDNAVEFDVAINTKE